MTARRLLAAVALAAAACSPHPKAPPLTGEAVYENDAAGFRFLTPAGWPVTSRATPPPGPLPRPVVLVSYEQPGGEKPAELAVLVADLPPDADLQKFLIDYRVGAEAWGQRSPPQAVTVNGVAAMHYSLTRRQGKDEMLREVTAFRRGGRVYFFLATFAASDESARATVRSSVESVAWK
jgi:hypothetical protein